MKTNIKVALSLCVVGIVLLALGAPLVAISFGLLAFAAVVWF